MKPWNDPTFTDQEKSEAIASGLGYRKQFLTCLEDNWFTPAGEFISAQRLCYPSILPDWLHDEVLAFAEVASHLPDGTDLRLYPSKNKVLVWGPDGKFICSGITAQTVCRAFYELVCVKEVPDAEV